MKRLKKLIKYALIFLIVLAISTFASYGFFKVKNEGWFKSEKGTTTTITNTTVVQQESSQATFLLYIPKLSVSAPIVTGVDPTDEAKYMNALTNGVLLMPGTGTPGKVGNIFIYGHSSSNINGNYQRIFATLNNLEAGDEIRIIRADKEYLYKVKEKKIVESTDVSVVNQTTEKETITLMTCWPIGTDQQRLVVLGERT